MIRVATIKDASRLAEIQIFSKRKAFRPIFQNDDVSFNEMSVLRLALYYQDVIGALDDIYVFDDGIVKGMMKLVSVSAILSCRPFFILIFLLCIKMKHYGFSRKSIWKNLETFP